VLTASSHVGFARRTAALFHVRGQATTAPAPRAQCEHCDSFPQEAVHFRLCSCVCLFVVTPSLHHRRRRLLVDGNLPSWKRERTVSVHRDLLAHSRVIRAEKDHCVGHAYRRITGAANRPTKGVPGMGANHYASIPFRLVRIKISRHDLAQSLFICRMNTPPLHCRALASQPLLCRLIVAPIQESRLV
jgi:hypothetical protein